MKKLLIIAMVTVFALSFVAGITAAKKPDNPFCAFVSCDYTKERVKFVCYNPANDNNYYLWSSDPADFERWCQ